MTASVRSKRWTLVRGLLATFVVVIIGIAIYGYSVYDKLSSYPGFAGTFTTNDKPVVFTLGTRTVSIPRNYFDVPIKEGAVSRDVLLIVLWPGMEPRAASNIAEFRDVPSWGRRIRILIDDPAQTTDLKYRFERMKETRGPLLPAGDAAGLHKYVRDQAAQSTLLPKELYFDGDESAITHFIWCNIDDPEINPGCEQRFSYEGFVFQANYSKRFLADWPQIREETIRLFDMFRAIPSNDTPIP